MTKQEVLFEIQNERRDRRFLVGSFIVGVIFAIIIGELTFYSIYTNVIKANDNDLEEGIQAEDIQEDEDIQFKPIEKIAFIKKGNIYIYDPRESKEVQLTSDAASDVMYSAYAWKNRDELSFSKCVDGKCYIQTYSIKERKTTDGFQVDAEDIGAMRWSHKGDKLAYIYTRDRNNLLSVKKETETVDLAPFSTSDDILFDYDDALYIRYSPSDERLMVVDTFVFEGSPSIVVFDCDGNIVTSLNKTNNTTPTFGSFGSEDTIYFKRGEFLYVRSLSTGDEALVTDRIKDGYDFLLSPDRTMFTYWTHDWLGGISTMWTYEIGTGEIGRLKDQSSKPTWLDSDNLVFSEIENCIQCELKELKYESLSKFEMNSRNTNSLTSIQENPYSLTDNL